MLVAFSVAPAGGSSSDSVHDAVAAAVKVVRASGLPNRTDAMFTTIEGEWDECMAVVRDAVEAVQAYGTRVGLVLKADIRPGHTEELTGKLDRLEEAIVRNEAPHGGVDIDGNVVPATAVVADEAGVADDARADGELAAADDDNPVDGPFVTGAGAGDEVAEHEGARTPLAEAGLVGAAAAGLAAASTYLGGTGAATAAESGLATDGSVVHESDAVENEVADHDLDETSTTGLATASSSIGGPADPYAPDDSTADWVDSPVADSQDVHRDAVRSGDEHDLDGVDEWAAGAAVGAVGAGTTGAAALAGSAEPTGVTIDDEGLESAPEVVETPSRPATILARFEASDPIVTIQGSGDDDLPIRCASDARIMVADAAPPEHLGLFPLSRAVLRTDGAVSITSGGDQHWSSEAGETVSVVVWSDDVDEPEGVWIEVSR